MGTLVITCVFDVIPSWQDLEPPDEALGTTVIDDLSHGHACEDYVD